MTKTLTFAVCHFSVAFGVTWLLTGSLAISGAMALAEPLVNTVTYHFHDLAWGRVAQRTALRHLALAKTLTFALCHFSVAFLLGYLLTGSVAIASLLAMVEPLVNTVAYYLHEKAWARFSPATLAPAPLCRHHFPPA